VLGIVLALAASMESGNRGKRQLLYLYGSHGLVNQLELQHGTAVAGARSPQRFRSLGRLSP
jgi:hypothetical protein